MTFKHIDFFDSPTMRELVRQDILKEKAKAALEGGVVKTASIDDSSSVPKDLTTEINKLAEGLRSKGFKKEAEELETNLINFKVAETHLYKVFEEDGEDLINFAHPGKAVDFGGAEGHGVVDNLVAAHKKILDIVNKEPKATKEASEEKKKIIKESQEVDFTVPSIDLTDHKLNKNDFAELKTPQDIKMYIMHGEDLVDKYNVGINGQLNKSEDLKSKDYFDESAEALKMSYLLKDRKEIVEHNIAVLNYILADMRIAGKQHLEQTKDLPVDIGEGKTMPYSKWVWWRDNVAGKVSRLIPYLTGDTKDIFKVVFDALKGAKSYPEALNNFPDKMKFYSNINKLDSVVMQWEDFIKKQSALNIVLKKEAQYAPPSVSALKAPLGPNTDPGPDYVGPAKAPATTAPATKPTRKAVLSKAEFNTVTDMQRGLNSLVDVFKSKGFKISKDDEAALTATGFGSGVDQRQTADAVDGRWGPNTSKALIVANKILKENGIDTIVFETNPPFSGGKRVIADDYSKVASDNLNKIKELSAANGVVLTENGGVIETTFDPYFKFTKDNFNSFDSLFNKLSVFPGFGPSMDPEWNEAGYSKSKWLEIFKFLGARASESKSPEYKAALSELFAKFRNLPESAFVDSSGEKLAVLSPGKLDGSSVHLDEAPQQMLAQKEPGYKGKEHGTGEGMDFESAEQKQKPQPFAKSVSTKVLEQYYHPRNIQAYRNLIPYLSYETLFTQPSMLVRQFASDVPWSEVLSVFNLSPNSQAMVSGKVYKDFAGRPVTWGELENMNIPQIENLVEAMKTKVSVNQVYKTLRALHSDMLEAKNDFIESGVPSQVAEGINRHYENWARAFDAAERNLTDYSRKLKL